MANNVVEIILKTIKQGDGEKQVSGALGGLNTGLINFSMGMTSIKQAYQVLAGVTQALVGDTLDYATQIRDLTRETGMSADEASRLTQVADDLQISFGALETAAKNAARQGITLTTDSLAKMSGEYLALEPGAERTRYALEMFGKQAGPEMQKFLEKGSGAIRNMSAAIDDNMILTETQVDAALDLELSWDGVTDAVQGVGYAIGNWLIPKLTTAANAALTLVTANQTLKDVLAQHEGTLRTTTSSYDEYVTSMLTAGLQAKQFEGAEKNLAEAYLDGTLEIQKRPAVLYMLMNSVDALSEVEYDNLEIIEANIGANQAWMEALDEGGVSVDTLGEKIHSLSVMDIDGLRTAMGGAVGNEMEDFRTKSGEIVDKMQGVRGQIAELTANPWLTKVQQDELKDLQTEYGNLQTELDETATAHETAMAKISYSLLEARLGIDGFTNAELEVLNNYAGITGLIDEPTRALNESIGALTTSWESGQAPVENYMKAVQYLDDAIKDGTISADEMHTALSLLNGMEIEVGINVSVHGDPIPDFGLNDPDAPIPFGEEPEGPINGMLAGGGTAREGLGYWVGEQGPEYFRPKSTGTVYPNGETPGGVHVHMYGAVTVRETEDIEKIAQRLAELVRRRK